MIFYSINLDKYSQETSMFSALEHGVYNLLVNFYMSEEFPIEDEMRYRIAKASTPEERKAVDFVLSRIFLRQGNVWVNEGCQAKLEEVYAKSRKAKAAADEKWRRKRERDAANGCSPDADAPEKICSDDANASKTHSETDADASPEHPKNAELPCETDANRERITNTSSAALAGADAPEPPPDSKWWFEEPDELVVEVAEFFASLPPRSQDGELRPEEFGVRRFVEFARASAAPLGESADEAIRALMAKASANYEQDIRTQKPKRSGQRPWLKSMLEWVEREAPKWKAPPAVSRSTGRGRSKADDNLARAMEGVGWQS